MWRHGDSPNPRDNHLGLDGKVFPANHPFWEIAHPSCAYGCKCRAFSLSEKDMQRMGKTISEPPDGNAIAESGFRRAAGTTPQNEQKRIIKQGVKKLSPELRKRVMSDLKSKGIV